MRIKKDFVLREVCGENVIMGENLKGAPGFFRGRPTQTLHDSINKGFICMSGRIVVPLRHLI